MARGMPAPPPGGDWRRRMAVRGGKVSHTLAAHGWLVFLLAGVGVGILVGLAIFLNVPVKPGDPSPGVRAFASMFVGVIFCTPPVVLLLGLPAQVLARSYLRSASPAEQEAMRRATESAPASLPDGLVAGSRWARAYSGCVGSVTAFHGVVRTVPDGAAKDWLHDIGRNLDAELAEALRTARMGESLESAGQGSEVARTVGARLEVARTAFHDTAELAASIALDLRVDSGFDDVRSQLDQLAAQAPHLRRQS